MPEGQNLGRFHYSRSYLAEHEGAAQVGKIPVDPVGDIIFSKADDEGRLCESEECCPGWRTAGQKWGL